MPISGSPATNKLENSRKEMENEETMPPGAPSVPELAQQLNIFPISNPHNSVQLPCEPAATNQSKTVIVDASQSLDETTHADGDCSAASSASQESTLNPNAAEFLLSTTLNLGVSPVASAPSPVAPNLSNDELLNSTFTSLSAPELRDSRILLEKSQASQTLQQTTPYKLPHIGMQITYPTYESNTQNNLDSLKASDEEEEDEDEDEQEHEEFFDKEFVRDDTYLDHKNAQRKARERDQHEVQSRRGRGRPPGTRRTYFDVVRTIGTRSKSID